MMIEISLAAKVLYKKQIEVTEKEYNKIINDVNNKGLSALTYIVDTSTLSPDSREFDIVDYCIKELL